MSREKSFDLRQRPETYWDEATMILANIKGDVRRQKIKEAVADGRADEFPSAIFSESLPEAVRAIAGRLDPVSMGGEYLPDYEPSEVEIARVTVNSAMRDVVSVRARPDGDLIRYRVTDENCDWDEWSYVLPRDTSKRPLTMGELIDLMDRTGVASSDPGGLVFCHGGYRDLRHSQMGLHELADFASVDSVFYPDLGDYYASEFKKRLEDELARRQREDAEFADEVTGDLSLKG